MLPVVLDPGGLEPPDVDIAGSVPPSPEAPLVGSGAVFEPPEVLDAALEVCELDA